jgi:hypothetical protein
VSDRTNNGRFTAGNGVAKKAKANQAPGLDGVVSSGGYLWTGETSSDLTGTRKWTTYANAFMRPSAAIALLLRSALLSSVKWTLSPNKAGGKDAERGMEIVQQGLLDTRLSTPWNRVFSRSANGRYFFGFSLFAKAMGRRKDGSVVYTDIAHRPQHTIDRWIRSDESAPFEAVSQFTRDGKRETLWLEDCLYLVNHDLMGDGPDGVGVLRLLIERMRRVGNYEMLEGVEMFSSMGGTPIARMPLEDINKTIAGTSADKQAAKRTELISPIETIVRDRIKTPEKQQYLILDSALQKGADPNVITSTPKWGIEILKGDLQGLPEIRKTITDEELNCARMFGVEFVFVGGGDSAGSYGMHESKVGVFAAGLKGDCEIGAVAARDQLARPLVMANGLDPDTATPEMVPSPITFASILETAQALTLINALNAKDPARNVLRERDDLPPEPEEMLLEMEASRMAPRFAPPADPNVEPVDPEQEVKLGEADQTKRRSR